MRQRYFNSATEELDHSQQALNQLRGERSKPLAPAIPKLNFWYILLAIGAFLLLKAGWSSKNADPLADARLNNARETAATVQPAATPMASVAPPPRAELVRLSPNVPRATVVNLGTPLEQKVTQWGESFWVHMPDSRWIVATALGRTNRLEDLPLTGNRIGDARWVDSHCFVWLNPIGQSNATWIDP